MSLFYFKNLYLLPSVFAINSNFNNKDIKLVVLVSFTLDENNINIRLYMYNELQTKLIN